MGRMAKRVTALALIASLALSARIPSPRACWKRVARDGTVTTECR